ncbi:hypothetical protein BIV57_21170 [Mangrovactinospora gilvigrisea]|uniref:Uncharacterized protein n=1 Tax=Mangrovactinospora gilvigrisea TaxID=1428644 RepID=A0A1J7BA72_9ACTN|nr:hypothetical protein [Mangrovactinospora gilvigrisea]OIV35510.1 hypothetical protein BIV57_21170 [Mangrovactinospora gilvigrisea]
MTNPPADGGPPDPAEALADADTAELQLLDAEALRRLHGEACIRCGEVAGLRPAGYAYTTTGDGTRYGWPVFTCPTHTTA